MTPKTAFRISLAAGLVVLALTVLSLLQTPPTPCGHLRAGYAPIIAFELARSQADFDAIFGTADDACRAAMIDRMDTTNWVDALLLVPVYSLFLIFFLVGMRTRQASLATFGIPVVLLASFGDYVENLCLMQLTANLDAQSFWASLLVWATGVKWLGLGAVSAIAASIYAQGQPRNLVAVIVCTLSAVLVVAAIVQPGKLGQLISPAVAIGWVTFLLTAAMGSKSSPAAN